MVRLHTMTIAALLSLVLPTGKSIAQEIRFSYSSLIGIQSPLWIAKDVGFFKKHGLDVNVVYTPGGLSVVHEMLAGRLQLAISTPAAVLRSNLGGSDFAYIGALSNRIDYSVVANKHVKSVQDLRGRKIAIGTLGAGPDYFGRIVFEKLGMRVGKDITFVTTVGGQPTRLAMLQSGSLDGAVLSPPYTLNAEQLGFSTVLHYASVIPHLFSNGYFARRKYLRDKPRIAENIVKALIDATRYVFSNPAETVDVLARRLQIDDVAFLRRYYQEVLVGQLDRDLYADGKGIETFLEQEHKTSSNAVNVTPDALFDTSILDKLRKKGY
ncbi:MAG TPA: ABC transporter substrate-binding protein [Candidatus Binatia bacterium]